MSRPVIWKGYSSIKAAAVGIVPVEATASAGGLVDSPAVWSRRGDDRFSHRGGNLRRRRTGAREHADGKRRQRLGDRHFLQKICQQRIAEQLARQKAEHVGPRDQPDRRVVGLALD